MYLTVFNYLLLLLLILFVALFLYGRKKQSHFDKLGIKCVKPLVPIVGTNFCILAGFENVAKFVKRIYNAYPDEKYVGLYDGFTPCILLKDLDLIKNVAIKDFDTFHDHRLFVDEDMDIFGKTLLGLTGSKWRDMRATLSPAFSSSKMKNMFGYIETCAKNMSEYFLKELDKQGVDVIDIEAKDTLSKYTIDTIATSAFGVEINSLKDEKNDFYRLSKLLSTVTYTQMVKLVTLFMFPNFSKKIHLSFFQPELTSFFTDLVKTAMKVREEKNIIRHDMIHLLMEAKKGTLMHEKIDDLSETGFSTVEESDVGKQTVKRKWDDDLLIAQAFLFFAGGFDTTSTVLAFFFYELARNPDIQQKLHEEIDEHRQKFGNTVSYYDLQKLKYLDMCFTETLRMWPPIAAVDRFCSKDYLLPPPNDSSEPYLVKKGSTIFIPSLALHFDPQYYTDPERFDPERFSEENKSKINATTYLPFGIGPRNCIGSRYALMVAKAILFHIFANFDVVVTKKTVIPVVLENVPFNAKAKNGIWVGLKKRVNEKNA